MDPANVESLRDGVSVVVPVYNSEGSLTPLVERLVAVLPSVAREWEVLLINDGSRDRSWEVIRELAARYPQVCGIRMLRNFGQHNALLAGTRAAQFTVTMTMDDDLQHHPEEIPKLLAKLAEGADVVYGTPTTLPHGFWRNFFSRFTKAALGFAMRIDTLVDISAFRAFRTELRRAFHAYNSPEVIIDVLLSWGTSSFTSVKCEHLPRTIGRSNYTPSKLFNSAMFILTGYSTAPLRLASSVGFVFTLFGVGVLAYVLCRYLISGGSVPGFPFLASAIAIFSGAQLFALGIMGEYLARIFNRSVERPVYVVKETTAQVIERRG
jgi:glycosyltransferase involved in cell wall biosynthesis